MTRVLLALALLSLTACGAPRAPAATPASAPMVAVPLAGGDDPEVASPAAPPPSDENAIREKSQSAPSVAANGFAFPDAAGWRKLNFHRYDRPELGVSLGYRFFNEAGQATVFVYDGGVASIPDDVEDDVVNDHFAQAQTELSHAADRGMYKEVTLLGKRLVRVGSQAMHHAHYRVVMPNGVALGSDIYLFTFEGQFLKVRVSYDETIARSASKGIESLLEALVGATEPPNRA